MSIKCTQELNLSSLFLEVCFSLLLKLIPNSVSKQIVFAYFFSIFQF